MIDFDYGEHILVIGQTQTGKTVFIRDNVLADFPNYIIYDVESAEKDRYDVISEVTVRSYTELKRALVAKACKIRYHPKSLDFVREFNGVCYIVFQYAHGYAVVMDELSHVSDAHRISPYHKAILVRGAKRKITHIGATQRPSHLLHQTVYTQSPHKFFFYMDESDVKRLSQRTSIGGLEELSNLPEYHCLYKGVGRDNIRTIKSIKRF